MRTRIYAYPTGTPKKGCGRWLIVCDYGSVTIAGTSKRQRTSEVFEGGFRDAERRARELEQRNEHIRPDKITVGEWLERWTRDHIDHTEPRTQYGYRQIVRKHLQPALGGIRLQELTALDVRAFYAEQKRKGLGATTITHQHRCLFAALAVAEENDLLDRNPMRKKKTIKPPVAEPREKYVLATPKERQRLLEAARTWKTSQEAKPRGRGRPTKPCDLYVPVLLGLGMGTRAGEVCGLKWSDVDLDAGVLRTAHSYDSTPKVATRIKATKTKLVRTARMPSLLADALRQAKARRKEEAIALGLGWSEERFVCCYADGTPYRPDRLSEQFRKMADEAGFDKRLVFHGLRHTAASMQESLGVSRAVTQARMGHSSAMMTDHYIHAFSADDAAAADLIDADLRPEKKAAQG